MSQKIVVIGAGQAAAAFVAKLRELDAECAITIVGDEPVIPYQRPPLSKKYMTGEMELERLMLRPSEWYDEHNIECRTGVSAESIDPVRKTIRLSSGEELPYDKLMIATGATPRHLAANAGGDLKGVYSLRTLADADAMGHEFAEGRRVLIVGGGYIGLEAASVAASRGLEVHLAEMAPRILQRVAAAETSDYFRELHQAKGVTIMEGAALNRLVSKDGHVTGAEFGDGSTLEVDFVLVGIGITPNAALAEAAGLRCGNGIEVDLAGRTSDPDIFAAGDCASFEFNGTRVRLESVANAIEQAEVAAHVIAGENVEYRPVPWFWSDQYDVKLQIAGLNLGYDKVVTRPGSREGAHSVWYFAGNKFLAVDAMNDPRAYMMGKRLLESGKQITPEQAADGGFDLKSLL